MLLDMGLNDYEAASLLLGDSSEDGYQKPTKTPPIVHGPHVYTNSARVRGDGDNEGFSEIEKQPKPTQLERPVIGPHILSF